MAMIMAAGAGRFLAWKEQKLEHRRFLDKNDSIEFEEPLKPPPRGLEWHQLDDQEWELRTVKNTPPIQQDAKDDPEDEDKEKDEDSDEGEEEEEEEEDEEATDAGTQSSVSQSNVAVPEFLEHVVMPEDTLAGICIRYKVKDRDLRRLNGFVGNQIRTCNSLIVPNNLAAGQKAKNEPIDQQLQAETKLLQRWSFSSRLKTPEANSYIASNNNNNKWDLDKAPKERRLEKSWKSQREIRGMPPPSTPRAQPPLLPPPPRNWLSRRGLRLLGKYPPKAAPVGRFKTGPARHLHRSTSNVETVSGTTVNSNW